MGIPSYFVHIVKNHSSIIKKFERNNITINNLYIDSNSIIYDGVNAIDYKNNNDLFEKNLISWICNKLVYYINLIEPTQKVLIAFDGVAPVAKLEQQRNRRYKTWYVNNKIQELKSDNKVDDTILKSKWDTTAITPGTKFMNKLYNGIEGYFQKQYKKKHNEEIIISGSDDCGEGEHKIYKEIRNNTIYHKNTNTIIYGLDADLIMLTLVHLKISENLYLFRETPQFISSINRNLIPDQHYVLDICELGDKLKYEMCKINTKNDKSTTAFINDYIFLGFFLGNDFMPHFPALNIRTNGIQILLETYSCLFVNTSFVLIDDKKIYWKNVRKLIEHLAKNEEKYCVEEMKKRTILEKKTQNNMGRFKSIEEKFMSCPIYDRVVEKYINIDEIGWQERYYKELFNIQINDDRRKQICINYLEGLEWNYKYYTNDCPDWKWKYNYKYPPLLEDLIKYVPYFDTEFIEFKQESPVKPLVQLAYVLPRNSLHLLPKNIYEALIINHKDWYKLDYEIIWAYCKYFWESHIVLPDINIDTLDELITNKIS